MLQQVFGADLDFPVRLAISLIVIAVLLGATVLVMRKLGGGSGRVAGRGRSGPRLAVVDAISIDPRRRLVLVRRDDVEHLLLTGGTTDIVVEPNITGGYVATGGLRPALPMERTGEHDAQPAAPAVAPPAARAPLPPRPEAPVLPPAQSDALTAAVAAAVAAPRDQDEPPVREAMGRPVLPSPADDAAPARREAGVRELRTGQAALPVPPDAEENQQAEAATPAAPAKDTTGSTPLWARGRAAAFQANLERHRVRAAQLEQTLPTLPEEEQATARLTLGKLHRRIEQLATQAEEAAAEEAAAEAQAAEAQAAESAPTARPETADAEKGTTAKAAAEKAAADKVAAEKAAAEKTAAEKAAAEKAAAEKAAAEKAAAEKAAAEKAAAEKAAAEKAAAEKVAAEKAAAEKAAAEKAAAEKAAAEKAAAEKAAAEKAAAEKAAAEKAAAEKAAAEKAAAEKAAAEKAAAEKAAAEKGAAEKAAAEQAAERRALDERLTADMMAALEAVEQAPSPPSPRPHPALRPAAHLEPIESPRTAPAVEPRLKEMAQRLDAALAKPIESRPAEDKLHLSLSDLLEDIEGSVAEAAAGTATPTADRPAASRFAPRAPREPIAPVVERPRTSFFSPRPRLLSETPEPAPVSRPALSPRSGDLFAEPSLREPPRVEPPVAAPAEPGSEPAVRPYRTAELNREPPLRPRTPVFISRRSEPPALANPAPQAAPPVPPAEPAADKDFLDDFDAEMANLLGRTPPRER